METRRQLEEYLEGERKIFDLPLLLLGSDFQKQRAMPDYHKNWEILRPSGLWLRPGVQTSYPSLFPVTGSLGVTVV